MRGGGGPLCKRDQYCNITDMPLALLIYEIILRTSIFTILASLVTISDLLEIVTQVINVQWTDIHMWTLHCSPESTHTPLH